MAAARRTVDGHRGAPGRPTGVAVPVARSQDMGSLIIMGKIESGVCKQGTKLIVYPNKTKVEVRRARIGPSPLEIALSVLALHGRPSAVMAGSSSSSQAHRLSPRAAAGGLVSQSKTGKAKQPPPRSRSGYSGVLSVGR